MTPELTKILDEPKEFWVSRKPMESFEDGLSKSAAFNWQTLNCIHVIEKAAYDQLLADARELQKALGNWLEWEKEQIAKEGPYCGKEITKLINDGNLSLETFTKKYGSAE